MEAAEDASNGDDAKGEAQSEDIASSAVEVKVMEESFIFSSWVVSWPLLLLPPIVATNSSSCSGCKRIGSCSAVFVVVIVVVVVVVMMAPRWFWSEGSLLRLLL